MSKSVRRRTPKGQTKQDKILSKLLSSSQGRAALALGLNADISLVDNVVPSGSLLDTIVKTLRRNTDLPPILGIGATMALASAALSEAGAVVRWPGESQDIELAQWIVMLAPSGAGKTLIRSVIGEALNLNPTTIPEPASGPAYLESLQKTGGRCLWSRDEYGQLIRSMTVGGPKEELRDLLLRSYDHDSLTHHTRTNGSIHVEHPVVTILATSVASTWVNCVDAEMLVDGFAARHLYFVTESRPLGVPRYPKDKIIAAIRRSAGDIGQRLSSRLTYEITPYADHVYHQLWHQLVGELGGTLDAAYVRRITWAAARYAVIYHIITGQRGTRVGSQAMRWAWRIVKLHCHCTKQVLAIADPEVDKGIERIRDMISKERAIGGNIYANTFATKVHQRCHRYISSTQEARQIIRLLAPHE